MNWTSNIQVLHSLEWDYAHKQISYFISKMIFTINTGKLLLNVLDKTTPAKFVAFFLNIYKYINVHCSWAWLLLAIDDFGTKCTLSHSTTDPSSDNFWHSEDHASWYILIMDRAPWPRQQTVNITSMTYTYCCVYSTRLMMMDSKPVRNM